MVVTTWLHLSDIHFGHGSAGHQWDQQLIASDLRRDAREVAQMGHLSAPDRVFVTGDVAFSGGGRLPVAGASEYELARRWLEDLAGDLDLGLEHIFVVPGNHDVDREVDAADREICRLVRGVREGLETLDDLLQHADDVEHLRRRMSRYLDFARVFGPTGREDYLGGLWWRHQVPLRDGVSLRICGVNTALLSADDEDQGRLRVGNRQLTDLLMPSPSELEIVVVLSHHPLTGKWLADEGIVRGRVDREAGLHLFGHLHEADSEQARHGWGAGCLRIAAGAAHAEAAAPGKAPVGHGYSVGALVLLPDGELVVRVWPRRWSSKSTRFVADTDNIDERKGYAEHVLRHRVPRRRLRPLTAGELVGERYRLLEKLGEGGVGQVWKAEDTIGDHGLVAVKVLNPDGRPSPVGRRQAFFRGAGEMARVRHPGIVRILDPGPSLEQSGGPHDFYAMELVDGQNLGQVFRARRCGEQRAIEILSAIIDAVAAAHAQKVVHRDLKPSNVLLGRDGSVKIVDFDTVKDVRDATRTRTGGHLVSDLYASPEVLDGSIVDGRADIYSIAVTGIFLLRGDDPPKSAINRMYDLVDGLDCSSDLREVLARGCAHDPRHRYGSLDELRIAMAAPKACGENTVSADKGSPQVDDFSTPSGTGVPVTPDAFLTRDETISASVHSADLPTIQSSPAPSSLLRSPSARSEALAGSIDVRGEPEGALPMQRPDRTPIWTPRASTTRISSASGVIEARSEALAADDSTPVRSNAAASPSASLSQAPITQPSIPVQAWWEGTPRPPAASTTPSADSGGGQWIPALPPSGPDTAGKNDDDELWPSKNPSIPVRPFIGIGAFVLVISTLWCSLGGEETPKSDLLSRSSTLIDKQPNGPNLPERGPKFLASPYGGAIGLSNSGLIGNFSRSTDQGPQLVTISNLEVQGYLVNDIVRRILRAHVNDLRSCYSQGLKRDQKLGGHVSIHFRIGGDGGVSSATVADSGVRDGGVVACFQEATWRWKFPKAAGESVVVYTAALAQG